MAHPIRRQRPIKGGRERLYSGVLPEIEQIVAQEAGRFFVSKSFVVNTALTDYFLSTNGEKYEKYYEETTQRAKPRKFIKPKSPAYKVKPSTRPDEDKE